MSGLKASLRNISSLRIGTMMLALVMLASALEDYYPKFELASHARMQCPIGAVVLMLWAFAAKRRAIAVFCAVLFFWAAGELAYTFYAIGSPPSSANITQQLSLLQFNAQFSNESREGLQQLQSLSKSYDVMVFAELPDRLGIIDDKAFKAAYPYHYLNIAGSVFFEGVAVYSKYPIETVRLQRAGLPEYAGLVRIFIPQKQVVIYALHSPTPASYRMQKQRDEQQRWLFSLLDAEPYPAIAVGDFNQTPYARGFQRAIKENDVHLAAFPYGVLPTWPRQFVLPILQIPIDLAVANGRMHILSRGRLFISGSDHVAVSNRLGWQQPAVSSAEPEQEQ